MTSPQGMPATVRPLREDWIVANAKQVRVSTGARPIVKSKKRVQEFAEVLTPTWLVDEMLDTVNDESERIDARFLEPACGDGNFLVRVLVRKLATAKSRYGKSPFEMRHQSLLGLMSIYGIEIQADNAEDCRNNLLDVFVTCLGLVTEDELIGAARAVLVANIVQGDALAMTTVNALSQMKEGPIVFAEWGYLGRGRFQRRDFLFNALAGRSSVQIGEASHEIFQPFRTYAPMTVKELAV